MTLELVPAQRLTEGVDPEIGFRSRRQNQFEFAFIDLGCFTPAAARKYFATPGHPGGVCERLFRHANKQRIGPSATWAVLFCCAAQHSSRRAAIC